MESCLLSLIDMLIANIPDLYSEDTTQEDKTDPNCSGSGQDQPRYNCRFTRYQQININYGYGRSNYSYESQQNYLTHRIGIKIKISFLLQKKKHIRDAFKKKNFIWREKFLTCFTPSPLQKQGIKQQGIFQLSLKASLCLQQGVLRFLTNWDVFCNFSLAYFYWKRKREILS